MVVATGKVRERQVSVRSVGWRRRRQWKRRRRRWRSRWVVGGGCRGDGARERSLGLAIAAAVVSGWLAGWLVLGGNERATKVRGEWGASASSGGVGGHKEHTACTSKGI